MKTFRFFDFPVYHQARDLYKEIFIITSKIHNYSLRDQTQRAALSIVLNIAEGSAKKSDKDFGRFLQISLGSLNELVACLDVLHNNYLLSPERYSELIRFCESIAKQLGGFLKKLYKK